jgi:hypothetical protein
MKYPMIRFKSLKLALKEMEPFIRDSRHLATGRPFKPDFNTQSMVGPDRKR